MCFWDCRSCRKRKRRARILDAVRTEQTFRQATLFVEATKQKLALIRVFTTALSTVFFALVSWFFVEYFGKESDGLVDLFIPYWTIPCLLIALFSLIVWHASLTRQMRWPPLLPADEDTSRRRGAG